MINQDFEGPSRTEHRAKLMALAPKFRLITNDDRSLVGRTISGICSEMGIVFKELY